MKWSRTAYAGYRAFVYLSAYSAITSTCVLHAFCWSAPFSFHRSTTTAGTRLLVFQPFSIHDATISTSTPHTPATPATTFQSLALEEHEQEIATGFDTFKTSTPDQSSETLSHDYNNPWSDSDFISYSVGIGNAGPDEFSLTNGDCIFQTKRPVFSKQTCQELIDEARDFITCGLKESLPQSFNDDESMITTTTTIQQQQPRNSQLGEARVSTLPKARAWLETTMRDTLLPLLESRFKCHAKDLTLHDALIIGYGYFGTPTQAQPLHRDSSILSLNVALSPFEDYEGGGTYFQALNHQNGQETIRNQQGHVMCHAGGAMHAGRSIDKGQRWVLVLFLLSSKHPQLARRCHAHGTRAKQAGDWQSAFQALQEGLHIAPNDHQLQLDMGSVFALRGDFAEARRRLAVTSRLYQPCYKAAYGLACDLDNKGQSRASLRWLETALDRIGDSDLQPNAWAPLQLAGYDARVKAAQIAIVLSMRSPIFAQEYVPRAIQWIRIALKNDPASELLLGMMDAAEMLRDKRAADV